MTAVPDRFDLAVIGGGVVGCAAFRAGVLAGLRCVLIEQAPDILEGASKGNSAILHTGFDAIPGSIEAACVRDGHALYCRIHARLGLPLLATGALLVAWTEAERAALPGILARAARNGVAAVPLDAAAVRGREKQLAADALDGVWIEGESVIDPWSAPLAYALQALANGGVLLRGAAVIGGTLADGTWTLDVAGRASVRAGVVVNCAGNQGDIVEAIARPSPFAIRPRRGQFLVFDKPAHDLVRAIILPVPSERTKGIVLTRTAFGNLLVGPTAEDQNDRATAATDAAALAALARAGERIVPALAGQEVTTAYAGLRPATQFKDYQIEALAERRWISAGGIRSTGLTGALGIARLVMELYETHFGRLAPLPDPVWPLVPNLAEAQPRPHAAAGRGEVVCHCEQVTAAEITAAMAGPLPAGSIGGLRRRTRCMMGRCQGFYCSARVLALAPSLLPPAATA